MSDHQEKIKDWQKKLELQFKDESHLYSYLFETLKNFSYRYLETTLDKDLSLQQLDQKTYFFSSTETNLKEALKLQNRELKDKLIDYAKVNREGKIDYKLTTKIHRLEAQGGELSFLLDVTFGDQKFTKKSEFSFSDIGIFRKRLALILEELLSSLL